jgi:hypothetical protein
MDQHAECSIQVGSADASGDKRSKLVATHSSDRAHATGSSWIPIRIQMLLACLMVLVGTALFVATGYMGVGRGGGTFGVLDLSYLYGSGRTWMEGKNAYKLPELQAVWATIVENEPTTQALKGQHSATLSSGFAYSPTSALPCVALSTLSLDGARMTFGAINFLSIMTIVGVIYWEARRRVLHPLLAWGWLATGLACAFAVGNPFGSHNAWMGQSTIPATALLCLGWMAKEKNRHILAGVLVACASYKIHIGILFLPIFLLERRWVSIAAGIVTGLILASIPLVKLGPIETLESWRGALAAYRDHPTAKVSFRYAFGLPSLMDALHLRGDWARPFSMLLGAASLGLVWWKRAWFTSFEIFALLMVLGLLLMQASNYDLIAASMLVAALAFRLGSSFVGLLLVGAACCSLAFPFRIIEDFKIPLLIRWREVTVLLVIAGFLWVVWKQPTSASDASRAAV